MAPSSFRHRGISRFRLQGLGFRGQVSKARMPSNLVIKRAPFLVLDNFIRPRTTKREKGPTGRPRRATIYTGFEQIRRAGYLEHCKTRPQKPEILNLHLRIIRLQSVYKAPIIQAPNLLGNHKTLNPKPPEPIWAELSSACFEA